MIGGVNDSILSDTGTEEEILDLMKSRDSSIKTMLKSEDSTYTDEQREKLKELINNIIDFEEMSRIALDQHWEDLSNEEKVEFVGIFSELVKRSSIKKLDIFHAVIEYKKIKVNGNKALAQTVATYKRTRTNVDYTFHLKNKEWLVTDFFIDEVSTAESYRKSFQKIIRKHSYQGLIERMRKKLLEETG